MANLLRRLGNVSLFLAGVVAGILWSVNADYEKNPFFQFVNIEYVLAVGTMVALSVLLRKAAARIS
jgi:hypothetical protein